MQHQGEARGEEEKKEIQQRNKGMRQSGAEKEVGVWWSSAIIAPYMKNLSELGHKSSCIIIKLASFNSSSYLNVMCIKSLSGMALSKVCICTSNTDKVLLNCFARALWTWKRHKFRFFREFQGRSPAIHLPNSYIVFELQSHHITTMLLVWFRTQRLDVLPISVWFFSGFLPHSKNMHNSLTGDI